MRSAKSTNSLANNHHQQQDCAGQRWQHDPTPKPVMASKNLANNPTSPICRCRVMYLGSSVPHITKDGLQGIQEPLRELYPDKTILASGNAGIDSWLSVWSNGILIENVDENGREVKRFFKIDALHYCAAVKYVPTPQINPYTTLPNGNLVNLPKFLPLDSPHVDQANTNQPIFASILRRTTGIKVLECHAFICKREAAANALVRCCFHAYADTMYAKQIGADVNGLNNNNNGTNNSNSNFPPEPTQLNDNQTDSRQLSLMKMRSKSMAGLNEPGQQRADVWAHNEANTNNGGTLRSIKSMAVNSIASTLLRSKKHAKAMSMAQLNQDRVTSFHQPHSNVSTMVGPVIPPVPSMFLPNMSKRPIINGSQTMRAPAKHMMPIVGPPMNFEAMTPKEMKKLLKKSAKYGIDASKFGENGLPLLSLRPPSMLQPCPIPQHSKSGTMVSQSMCSDMHSSDMLDIASIHGLQTPRGPIADQLDHLPMKPILVKPNPEFLKSKSGKKWLKQQKEFKKLLPPHLDGLPIIFGPPPVDAMEPVAMPVNNVMSPAFVPQHPGLPIMSPKYYNPFYGQSDRASASLRHSPQSQIMHSTNSNGMKGQYYDNEYAQRNQLIYSNDIPDHLNPMLRPQFSRDYGDDSSLIYGVNECGVDLQNGQFVRDRNRNHMVEQSIISLGDENDFDNELEEEISSHSERHRASRSISGASVRGRNNEHMDNYHDNRNHDQRIYYQTMQTADDQSSYSSGIYKKGHINERAFSYSIRQEHQSSGPGSDNEYQRR